VTVRRPLAGLAWGTLTALAALAALAPFAGRAGAQMRHGGVPERVVARQRAGPYLVSVWAKPDVGMGMLYVVYDAPAGAAFVAPTSVRVGVAPASGRRPEVLYDAHPEPVEHGARYVAHVGFDRGGTWRVRVRTDGPAGGGEVTAQVVASAVGLGPFDIALYALPVVLILGLWGQAAVARRHAAGGSARHGHDHPLVARQRGAPVVGRLEHDLDGLPGGRVGRHREARAE
jgi:hypothetical protein